MIERLRFDEQPDPVAPPPHNLDAEEAVLGSVFLDREVIGRVASVLTARDFYREQHGAIFTAMLALYDRMEPVDYLTLRDELERTDRLDAAGGGDGLAGLLMAVPTPVHAESYARIVAEAAVMRRLISAGGKIATLGFRHQDDAETAIARAEAILLDVASTRAGSQAHRSIGTVLGEYLERLAQLREGTATSAAVPTGYLDLDGILKGGLHRSDLVVLAARPAMGKSALAMGIAANAALRFGANVAVFSLEMSDDQLTSRVLAVESGIETPRLEQGTFTPAEERRLGHALGTIMEAPIQIDDTAGLSVQDLRARVRRMQHDRALDLVIVDHISIMTAGRGGAGNSGNRVQEVAEITRQLKVLAKEQHLPVLALCQLSRAVEQRSPKIPHLADLRESGAIEQDADVVIFIYRDDYYRPDDSDRPGVADLIVAKHRNGPTGQVSLLFDQRTTRFLDLEVGW